MTITKPPIAETVRNLIRAELDLPDLHALVDDPVTTLATLRIDGISRTHLAMQIEDVFHVHFGDEEVQAWHAVCDVIRSVEGKVHALHNLR